jgi:hypothetical protein
MSEGFETDEWSHDVRVFPLDDEPFDTQIGNIFVPAPGWRFWFRHDPDNLDQPEGKNVWATGDPVRIHSGNGAYLYFTFFRKHDAGLMRKVAVAPGTRVKLTAYAHAWSNSKDGPHGDDPRWSEGPGYDAGFLLTNQQPPESSPGTEDDWRNFTFWLGVDPTGSEDPTAPSVLWGMGAHIYNEHAQVPSVEAVADGGAVTVFLRSRTLWPFKHNDAYWDDVMLEEIESGNGDDDERGQPREQYERTYVLLPPEMTAQEAVEATRATFPQRQTIGYSADDGGIGNLDVRNVRAVNPEQWGDGLEAFYEEHYPGVNYEPIYADSAAELFYALQPRLVDGPGNVWQKAPAWKDINLGGPEGTETIGTHGCVLCCICDMLREVALWPALPPDLNRLLWEAEAFHNDDWMRWERVGQLFSVVDFDHRSDDGAGNYDAEYILALLVAGHKVIAAVNEGQHFVYVVGMDGNKVLCRDPWYDEAQRERDASEVSGLRVYRTNGEGNGGEEPEPVERLTRGHIGLHLQGNAEGVTDFVRRVEPSVMKCVFGFERALDIKWASPETAVILRHCENNSEPYVYHDGGPLAGARAWIDLFRDSLENIVAQLLDFCPDQDPVLYVESINEMYACGAYESNLAVRDFDIAFCEAVREMGMPIGPVPFTAAVGNPGEDEYEAMVPLARACAEAKGAMGYHPYWLSNPQYGGPDHLWPYLAGRWAEMDKVFVQHGVKVRWFGGESGTVGGESGEGWVSLFAHDGWKSPECLDGDWDRYLREIMRFDELVRDWNAENGDRFLGAVLFTTSGPGWDSFDIGSGEIAAIGDALMERYD